MCCSYHIQSSITLISKTKRANPWVSPLIVLVMRQIVCYWDVNDGSTWRERSPVSSENHRAGLACQVYQIANLPVKSIHSDSSPKNYVMRILQFQKIFFSETIKLIRILWKCLCRVCFSCSRWRLALLPNIPTWNRCVTSIYASLFAFAFAFAFAHLGLHVCTFIDPLQVALRNWDWTAHETKLKWNWEENYFFWTTYKPCR